MWLRQRRRTITDVVIEAKDRGVSPVVVLHAYAGQAQLLGHPAFGNLHRDDQPGEFPLDSGGQNIIGIDPDGGANI